MLFSFLFIFFSAYSYGDNCHAESAQGLRTCFHSMNAAKEGPKVDCDPVRPECMEKVQNFVSDGTVNISMAFGYGDSDGALKDRVWSEFYYNRTVKFLTTPCPSVFQGFSKDPSKYRGNNNTINNLMSQMKNTNCGEQAEFDRACGFSRTDDPEVFIKSHVIMGKKVDVKVRIVNSALSASDEANRLSQNDFITTHFCQGRAGDNLKACINKHTPPQFPLEELAKKCQRGDEHSNQICRSGYTKNFWLDSIKNGDEMVMYFGHARYGGGPSFEPPKVFSSGYIDANYYEKNRLGHLAEADALKFAASKNKAPVYYNSLSCNSHVRFYSQGKLPQASPSTSYVLSSRTAFTIEGLAASMATIDGTLNGLCGEELNKKIRGASCAYRLYNH